MTAQEALDYGFIDEIIGESKIAASIDGDFLICGNIKVDTGKFNNFESIKDKIETYREPEKPTEPVATAKDDKSMFIEDCLQYTDYSKKHCETIWSSRETIIEQDGKDADLLDVSNKEYKKRRAEALKKKNAVVMRATYHN